MYYYQDGTVGSATVRVDIKRLHQFLCGDQLLTEVNSYNTIGFTVVVSGGTNMLPDSELCTLDKSKSELIY